MDTQILNNLANWMMIEKCKELGIDCSNTYVQRQMVAQRNRQRLYWLANYETKRPVMQIVFSKSQAPQYNYSREEL